MQNGQRKRIYYVSFYDGKACSDKRKTRSNIAGSILTEGLIRALKNIGYKVILISPMAPERQGIFPEEHIVIDEQEEQYFLACQQIKIMGKLRGGTHAAINSLKNFIRKHVKKDDIVISYHSLGYGRMFDNLRNTIGFKWIAEIAEIYCLSQGDYLAPELYEDELGMFANADARIFLGDNLKNKYKKSDMDLAFYGNYEVFCPHKKLPDKTINLAYTGIINKDRGVITIVDVMKYLDKKYRLYILGHGKNENIDFLKERIAEENKQFTEERIFFCGTRTGKEYDEFLADKHIGISLITQQGTIADNAFPGKMMSYMAHSLFVLSSDNPGIRNSKLGSHIYFCNNDPDSIAHALKTIPTNDGCSNGEFLGSLENDFEEQLKDLLESLEAEV